MFPARLVLSALTFAFSAFAAPESVSLLTGVPVQLRLQNSVTPATVARGSDVPFVVMHDVVVDGVLIIPQGSAVSAKVSSAKPLTSSNKGASLRLKLSSIRLSSGLLVPVTAVLASQPQSSGITTTAGVIPTQLAAEGPSPLSLFLVGKNPALTAGALVTAYVAKDVAINVAKLSPRKGDAVGNAGPGVSGTLSNPVVVAMVQSGTPVDQIVARVRSSPAHYNLETDDMAALKRAGVPAVVLQAMIHANKPK